MAELGVSFAFAERGLQEALNRLGVLVDFSGVTLMEEIAALGESQTRRRISEEKSAPDGTPWKPNLAGTSILVATGQNLLASVGFTSDADTAEWGAAWEFAHIHQEGATITPKTAQALQFKLGGRTVHAKSVTIPARPFVGLSADNRAEIDDLIIDHFGRIVGGGR